MASSSRLHASFLCFLILCAVVNVCQSAVATADDVNNGDIDGSISDDINEGSGGVEDSTSPPERDETSENPHGDVMTEIMIPGETTNSSGDAVDEESKTTLQYAPPTHFQITAHVQTNLHTGYSYFLPNDLLPSSFAHLPFLECGAVGSTTEIMPLVSGVFRHVPHTAVVPKREGVLDQAVLDQLEGMNDEGDAGNNLDGMDMLSGEGVNQHNGTSDDQDGATKEDVGRDDLPKRPSPPKYVVALTAMEITVGGNGNETHKFNAGDVIFIEDTWWGVWDDEDLSHGDGSSNLKDNDRATTNNASSMNKMKGYIMRATPDSQADLNVLMLTVPNAIHRQFKNAQYAMAKARRERRQEAMQKRQPQKLPSYGNAYEFGTKRPWWKRPAAFLKNPQQHHNTKQPSAIPKPCSLESDPAFANPAASTTTLSEHFTHHFTGLLRRSTNPHNTFLPHHHQDLLVPILAQTAAAVLGGAMAWALVLQLWRIIPGPIAMGFGSLCLIGAGTWGFVWLGEEILDQWELWRERRRLERMMSEGWGGAGNGGARGDRAS